MPPAPAGVSTALVPLLVVLLVVVFVGVARYRLADAPLERDEGEYAYAGQLILRGASPYTLAYNMKFPGTYYAYALSMAAFGGTARGVRTGFLLVNAATTLLLFALGRRLLGDRGGAVAAVAFAVLAVGHGVLGLFAHATQFVLLPTLAAFHLLLAAGQRGRAPVLLAAGVLLGVAALMKQQAVAFVPLAAYVAARGGGRAARERAADLGALALGVLVPVAVLVLAFWRLGILGRFWFWTFDYARAYVSEVSLGRVVPNLVSILGAVVGRARWLWLIAAIGVPCLWIGRWPAPTRTFVLGLLLTAFLAVCPGWYFRPHYFVLMLPAVALLVGVAVVTATERARWGLPLGAARFAGLALFATVVLGAVWAQRDLLFAPSAVEMTRRAYPGNPFVEAVEVARYVRARTSATDRIAVLGSEPEIYFYAGRRSATGYIYMYPFFEPQPYAARMQDEMVRQIETARPRYLVFVQCDLSWGVRRGAPRTVLDWAWRYDNTCYRLVGLVDSPWSEPPRYVWGTQAASYSPVSSNLIFVYERRSDAPCAVGDGG